jgi:hypothetical protein
LLPGALSYSLASGDGCIAIDHNKKKKMKAKEKTRIWTGHMDVDGMYWSSRLAGGERYRNRNECWGERRGWIE